jgi:hypothetical protein
MRVLQRPNSDGGWLSRSLNRKDIKGTKDMKKQKLQQRIGRMKADQNGLSLPSTGNHQRHSTRETRSILARNDPF